MTDNGQPIESTAVEVGTEVVPVAQPSTIFRTEDPMEIMQRTTEVAGALKEFIGRQGLVSRISNRDYIVVEGWQMLGMLLGVTPGSVITRPVTDGWEAVVELHDRSGRVVGGGEAECLASERTWKSRDDYARRSMAQTRAIGKAYRNTFGFIAKAAGFEATPAEEMPREEPAQAQQPEAATSKPLSEANREKVLLAIEDAKQPVPLVLASVGVDSPEELTAQHAHQIRGLLDRIAEKAS